MSKTVFLFPGQGAQAIGMGEAFYNEFPVAREVFEMADEITKSHLTRLCFKGPMEDLTRTVNLQPAITAVNLALFASLKSVGGDGFDVACGHSLGEYAALSAAEVLRPEDALWLVKRRGELMDEQAMKYKGAMAAVMRMAMADVEGLAEEIREAGAPFYKGVWAANHNADGQIVVSGDPESVKRFGEEAKGRGGRAIPLKVSGAWHSPLIQGAQKPFAMELESVNFAAPKKEVVFNVAAKSEGDPQVMRENMSRQLVNPVKWHDTMMRLVEEGATRFVEVGPGRVLSGIARKLPEARDFEIYNIATLDDLEGWMRAR